MINKILLLGILALLLLTVYAESANWLNYVEDKGGSRIYVDMESIKSTSANTIKLLKKVEPGGLSGIDSVLSEMEMDCGNSMIRYLKVTTYFNDGKSEIASRDEEFRKVTVEDDDELLMELVCSLKKSK